MGGGGRRGFGILLLRWAQQKSLEQLAITSYDSLQAYNSLFERTYYQKDVLASQIWRCFFFAHFQLIKICHRQNVDARRAAASYQHLFILYMFCSYKDPVLRSRNLPQPTGTEQALLGETRCHAGRFPREIAIQRCNRDQTRSESEGMTGVNSFGLSNEDANAVFP